MEEGGLEGGGGPGAGDIEDGVGDGASGHSSRSRKNPETIALFLAALEEMPLVNRAARAAGVHPRTVYDWRQKDPEFRAAWAESLDIGIERIEEVTHRAALEDGTREGTLQRIFTLKRWRPEYRDNVTVRHEGGGQDAQDAALLRRAMVEALGPYPEARAALAAHLARLSAGMGGDGGPAPGAPGGSGEVAGAQLVAVTTPPPGAGACGDAGAGGERPAASGGPVQAASTSTTPVLKGRIPDTEKIIDAEYEEVGDDDPGSGAEC